MIGRKIKVPTVLQMEALECGAAALGMVLAYYKRWAPLEDLRILCGVSRDGSKAINIVKAARSLGLKAEGRRCEPGELDGLTLPAVLFVNMNHFVVLEGVEKKGFRINDPASGRRVVPKDEFGGMFSGVALVFSPTENFQPEGHEPAVLPELLKMVRSSWRPVALVVVAGIIMALLALLLPAFQRIYLDRILIERLDDWVAPLLWAVAIVVPLIGAMTYLHGKLVAAIGAKLSIVLSSRMVWHVLRLPIPFFAQRYAGMVSSRVNLADQLATTTVQNLAEVLINGTLVLVLIALMMQYSLPLTLICIGLTFTNVVLFRVLQKSLAEGSDKAAMQLVKMEGRAMQGLQMMETLKATGTDGMFFARWAGLQALYVNAQQGIAQRQALIQALPTLTATAASAVVLVVGGYYTMADDFTIGMLVAFTVILSMFTKPVAALVDLATMLQDARGGLAQVADTLQHPRAGEFTVSETQENCEKRTATASLKQLTGQLRIEGVSFGYAPLEKPLIENFSLEMTPGSRVALVGSSGSGKSTVGKLAAGLLEAQSGQVLYDDMPLLEIPRDVLRNSLAVIDQEIVLFQGSVRENLTMWDDTMPQERVVAAAKDAMIHEIILGRQGGYDAFIDENGRNLSGGQRQRLEIARALVGNPSFLVLDEATSALDAVTEKQIIDNLHRRGCTCLMIAHRLSTIRDCDEIVVMHQGQVLQRGSHDQLMEEGGPYRRLIET